jgi:adhesin transport system outer membrane protein
MKLKPVVVALCIAAATAPAVAQTSGDALRNAAQKAISGNPDVAARANALRASADAVDVARGAWLPRVDASATVGRTRDRVDDRVPEAQSVSQSSIALSLTQTLWDGLATFHDVRRAGHDRLTRWFELQDTTEQTALEAVRATYDVLRFRRLVSLAEDNYVSHKYVFGQIDSRFRAGVGRGVDLEQAGARLALAESNLVTELSNLHDVSARYQRLVGEAPPVQLALPAPLRDGVAASADSAGQDAMRASALINAAVENLRAQRAIASLRNAAYQPRVEARLRTAGGRNLDGFPDQRRDTSAELVLNWNLFNGGIDAARARQQADLVNQAADLRDRACREVRQTAGIAFNDTRKLAEQLMLLDRNTIAIEKARDAYRQQFDIGQRSLLDLLNAENELYTARRAYANAEHDLGIAYARSHASSQQLVTRLGLSPVDTGVETPGAAGWSAGEDVPGRCPAEAMAVRGTDRSALDARATRLQQSAPPLPAAPAPAPAAPRR